MMRSARLFLASAVAAATLSFALPSAASTPTAAIKTLLGLQTQPAAEPYIYVERNGNGVRGVVAQVIPMPVEHVLTEVIMCYGAFPEWFPLQKDARYVTEVVDQRATIYGNLEFPWPIGARDFEAEIHGWLDESKRPEVFRIDFKHVEGTGNIGMMEGTWKLQAYGPDKTLVVYDSTADFNTWVPSFLLARGTKQFLPAIMDRMATRTSQCPASSKPKGNLPIR